MTRSNRKRVLALILVGALSLATSGAGAKVLLYTPDGRVVKIKGGVTQPDLSRYRSPLESKVVDRRIYTNDATFMANEGYKFGMEGFDDMVKASMPVAYRRAFQWVTAREMYFYARYFLGSMAASGRAGVHMVRGPYWQMQAMRHSAFNTPKLPAIEMPNMPAMPPEMAFSPKAMMLGVYLPFVYQRTGFPRVFNGVHPNYLPYKSVDPHFTGKPDSRDNFKDPMSGKAGGWGVPNTYLNYVQLSFDHQKMDTTFDMGALGQFLKRRAQWADYFFHSEHEGESPVSPGKKVILLGNDAEEGLRGWGLTMMSLNQILKVKSSMFTDGKELLGLGANYDPAKGLRYLPHEIQPMIMRLPPPLPERVGGMAIKDNSSPLWDQAAWIWGTSQYATMVARRSKAFTDNPPVDGGLIAKDTSLVAEDIGNAVFKNVEAMHVRDGILVSEWKPDTKTGSKITLRDITMAMVALRDLEQTWDAIEKYPEIAERARVLLENNARFLLEVQGADGSFSEAYEVPGGGPIGGNDLATPNWAAVRALLAAYFTTEDENFLVGARKTFNMLNRDYWVEAHGVYRSRRGDDTVVVEQYDLGVMLSAIREMLFTTPPHMADAQINRITRWWIQTVDQSGLIQAETQRTGEIYTGFVSADDDGDGIPVAGRAHGLNGIAPLMAAKVLINVGGKNNTAFAALEGETHNPNKYKTVTMRYEPKSQAEQAAIQLPLKNPKGPDLMTREPMERVDGTIIPLPASKPIKVGLGTELNLTGKQIFEANCSLCHGQHGEAIDGLELEKDMDRDHAAMFKIVNTGRFDKFMPPWGVGNGDKFGGTLTKAEIDKVVDYVQSPEFATNYKKVQNAEVIPGSLPKDVWFYLSRENVKAKGKKISNAEDAKRFFDQHQDPATIKAASWEDLPRRESTRN